MATVTIDPPEAPDTPSQAIVRAAAAVTTVPDPSGRQIGVRRILPLDRMRLFEVVGPDNSKNEAYLGYASLAFHVSSIDGDPVPRPATKAQLEALVQRLGDDGLTAVGEAVAALYEPPAADPEQTLKNASGTPT